MFFRSRQLTPRPTVFIQELTARSHLVSLSSRRRTLSRPDVAQAILKSDMFDFLIDIVPREEEDGGPPAAGGSAGKKRGKGKGRKKREVEVEEEEEVEEPVAQRRRVEEEREPVEGTTLLEQLQRSKEALLLQHAAENGGARPNGNGQVRLLADLPRGTLLISLSAQGIPA